MRETIFMYTLGCVLVAGILIAYLRQKGWLKLKRSSLDGFQDGELARLIKDSANTALELKILFLVPLALLFANVIMSLTVAIFTTDTKIPFAKDPNVQIPDFLEPEFSLRQVIDIFTNAPVQFNHPIYGVYSSSILLIFISLIAILAGKKTINLINSKIGNTNNSAFQLTKNIFITTYFLISIAIINSVFVILKQDNHSTGINFVLLAISVFPISVLVGSFIQSALAIIIKMHIIHKENSKDEIVKIAFRAMPRLFLLNMILFIASTSFLSLLLTSQQFMAPDNINVYFINYIIPYQRYLYFIICALIPMLSFILTDDTTFKDGLKANMVLIYENLKKYIILLSCSLVAISLPSIIQLAISGTYFSVSILSFFYDFVFSGIQLLVSFISVIAFGYLYAKTSQQSH